MTKTGYLAVESSAALARELADATRSNAVLKLGRDTVPRDDITTAQTFKQWPYRIFWLAAADNRRKPRRWTVAEEIAPESYWGPHGAVQKRALDALAAVTAEHRADIGVQEERLNNMRDGYTSSLLLVPRDRVLDLYDYLLLVYRVRNMIDRRTARPPGDLVFDAMSGAVRIGGNWSTGRVADLAYFITAMDDLSDGEIEKAFAFWGFAVNAAELRADRGAIRPLVRPG